MADILINEIEKLPRASDNPTSCRETFEAINARIIHLEQTGAKMNADRVWRRIIFSKFPESICTTAIQEEALQDDSFNVAEILNTIDSIISLRETILLTTETLFPTDYHSNDQENEGVTRREEEHFSKAKRLCLCGQLHSPYTCQRYTTPEARQREATNQGVCWRCLQETTTRTLARILERALNAKDHTTDLFACQKQDNAADFPRKSETLHSTIINTHLLLCHHVTPIRNVMR